MKGWRWMSVRGGRDSGSSPSKAVLMLPFWVSNGHACGVGSRKIATGSIRARRTEGMGSKGIRPNYDMPSWSSKFALRRPWKFEDNVRPGAFLEHPEFARRCFECQGWGGILSVVIKTPPGESKNTLPGSQKVSVKGKLSCNFLTRLS